MPTPPKPFTVLTSEKKSHRTKKELKQRKKGEEALSTGTTIKARPEIKNNPVAYKEFKRLNELLATIGKNDAIHENVINRYCLMCAECVDFEEKRESFYRDIEELTRDKERLIENEEMSLSAYYKMKHNMQTTIINLDRQVQAKRKMLLDIEKENVMTIAAALRSIPKKEEKSSNALLEALKDG
ncbi:hypothetical protein LPY66_18225 [Dehalobacter sp. DCM]|uniref:hypothetical protein n=1 Tax=Dehalobacter sp. DCM TaxID=2907827 RepID=UPI003081FE88|nr:hypothetical protein LPY66_18225 [Dehalobacter sp. DCM]